MNLPTTRPTQCSVHTAGSVKDFLDYLLPSAPQWNSANRGDLAYRGQASSQWPLLPAAFRAGPKIGYEPRAATQRLDRVVLQSQAEFHAVREFVKTADRSGLPITAAGARLLPEDDPRDIFGDQHWAYRWPAAEILESVALAQHHGIPTRLLDFTEDPLVGAFFAAFSAWDLKKRQTVAENHRSHLAVWVIDLRFVRALNRIRSRYPERIGEVRVPRANNTYLHAQSGFFLIDRGANDVMTLGGSLSIDQVAVESAQFWHNGNRLASRRIRRTWFDEIPIKQVRLPANQTLALLVELEKHGVTKSSLMPSLDRVADSLEFRQSFMNPMPVIWPFLGLRRRQDQASNRPRA